MACNHKIYDHFYSHDIVHGHIKLPLVVKAIIDTPHFQRLRKIKQLGFGSYVYVNATHSRFEHCIGTAYVTSELIRSIKQNSGIEGLVTPEEELCLIIGGLCHDLGHGPFSHFFSKLVDKTWSHENMSLMMLDDLLKNNEHTVKCFEEYGLFQNHVDFIKSIIIGEPVGGFSVPTLCIDGQALKKSFLFEIVANHSHGIDTDKLDYLKRDSMMIGQPCTFDIARLFDNMTVLESNEELLLCFNHKLMLDCNEIFHSRWAMQKNVYFHKTVLSINLMVAKALKMCDDVFKFEVNSLNPEIFLALTDEIISPIYFSKSADYNAAKTILDNVIIRNIYKLGGKFLIKDKLSEAEFQNMRIGLNKLKDDIFSNNIYKILEIEWDILEFGFQSGNVSNPLERVNFFKKLNNKPFNIDTLEMSRLITKFGTEKYLMIYYQTEDCSEENISNIIKLIEDWWVV